MLAFSIATALQISYGYWRSTASPQARRLVVGLGLLLGLRLALWISAGLGWQGLFNATQVLPPLEQAVNLLSLLVIVWLWAFPEPSRYADLATALVGLLIVTLSILGILWLASAPESQSFNGSLLDTINNVAALVLIGSGALILIRAAARRLEYRFIHARASGGRASPVPGQFRIGRRLFGRYCVFSR